MHSLLKTLILIFCIFFLSLPVSAKSKSVSTDSQSNIKPVTAKPEQKTNFTVTPSPFKVQSVTFKPMAYQGGTHLVAAVVFNRNLDKSSVRVNNNIRLLKKDDQHFWRDASTQNNIIRIRPNFITWICGKPLDDKVYVMHLRGTIKSADGVYLDCNGDGKGEGGNLPAYESSLYQHDVIEQIREKVINK